MGNMNIEYQDSIFLILCFVLAVVGAILISVLIPSLLVGMGFSESTVVPWTEETAKLICLSGFFLGIYDWKKNEDNLFFVLILSGLLFGFAFGSLETLASEKYRINFFKRSLTSIPAHGLWTAIASTGLWFPLRDYLEHRNWDRLWRKLWIIIVSTFTAVLFHLLWNELTPQGTMKWVFWPVIGLIVFLTLSKMD